MINQPSVEPSFLGEASSWAEFKWFLWRLRANPYWVASSWERFQISKWLALFRAAEPVCRSSCQADEEGLQPIKLIYFLLWLLPCQASSWFQPRHCLLCLTNTSLSNSEFFSFTDDDVQMLVESKKCPNHHSPVSQSDPHSVIYPLEEFALLRHLILINMRKSLIEYICILLLSLPLLDFLHFFRQFLLFQRLPLQLSYLLRHAPLLDSSKGISGVVANCFFVFALFSSNHSNFSFLHHSINTFITEPFRSKDFLKPSKSLKLT